MANSKIAWEIAQEANTEDITALRTTLDADISLGKYRSRLANILQTHTNDVEAQDPSLGRHHTCTAPGSWFAPRQFEMAFPIDEFGWHPELARKRGEDIARDVSALIVGYEQQVVIDALSNLPFAFSNEGRLSGMISSVPCWTTSPSPSGLSGMSQPVPQPMNIGKVMRVDSMLTSRGQLGPKIFLGLEESARLVSADNPGFLSCSPLAGCGHAVFRDRNSNLWVSSAQSILCHRETNRGIHVAQSFDNGKPVYLAVEFAFDPSAVAYVEEPGQPKVSIHVHKNRSYRAIVITVTMNFGARVVDPNLVLRLNNAIPDHVIENELSAIQMMTSREHRCLARFEHLPYSLLIA